MATKKNEGDKLKLEAKSRDVFGKKLRKLRHSGLVPANVFGPDFKSKSITLDAKEFMKVYRIAKETGIIYLHLEKEEIPVLVRLIQKHPVTDYILHVDFRKIDLTKKIETEVPVRVINESEAVAQKGGVLLTLSENLLVESLPGDIPQHIEVDISVIKEVGQEIKVADLPKSQKFEIKEDPQKVVVSVVEHKEESVTPETTAAAPEVITAAPAEGETPVEGTPQPETTTATQKEPAKEAGKKTETQQKSEPKK